MVKNFGPFALEWGALALAQISGFGMDFSALMGQLVTFN